MKKHMCSVIASLTIILLLSGCSKSPTDSNGTQTGGDFEIKISSGIQPTYTWSVGDAFSLSVVRTEEPVKIVWGIATPGRDGIASGVTHGTVPSSAFPSSEIEKKLESGVSYRVSVSQISGKIGWTDFTAK